MVCGSNAVLSCRSSAPPSMTRQLHSCWDPLTQVSGSAAAMAPCALVHCCASVVHASAVPSSSVCCREQSRVGCACVHVPSMPSDRTFPTSNPDLMPTLSPPHAAPPCPAPLSCLYGQTPSLTCQRLRSAGLPRLRQGVPLLVLRERGLVASMRQRPTHSTLAACPLSGTLTR